MGYLFILQRNTQLDHGKFQVVHESELTHMQASRIFGHRSSYPQTRIHDFSQTIELRGNVGSIHKLAWQHVSLFVREVIGIKLILYLTKYSNAYFHTKIARKAR